MNMINGGSLLNGNTLELHYWFSDASHRMDAFVQNKCEQEFLGVLKEVASIFDADVVIETEPFANGGLRRLFKIALKEESKKATITTAIITALVASIFITPITSSISKATEKLIEVIFEDKEIKELEKEKLRLEVERLRQEVHRNNQSLDTNSLIKKRKSNFYENLERYSKIDKVSFIVEDENMAHLSDEKVISREEFKKFLLVSDELEPIEIDNAIIEIISPVLKKGAYKWVGIYNGETVSFNMRSKEFKMLVQSGVIQFKNGTSINCFLIIRKKINNDGGEKIIGFDVERVNKYFENDKPIETPEGKRYRQKKEASAQQISLFAGNE